MQTLMHLIDLGVSVARQRAMKIGSTVLFTVAALVAGCGGSGDDQGSSGGLPAPSGEVARLEVSPTAILLVGNGKSQRLSVRAFDANGAEVPNPLVTFTSSRSSEVAVSSDGTLTALGGVGSALISVSSGAIVAKPVAAVVADPAPGALLVSDDQVVVAPTPIDPAAIGAVGDRYRVTLSGVGSPAAGTLLIGTGGQPLAGRVVSAIDGGANVDVVLELVALPQLFKDLRVNLSFAGQVSPSGTSTCSLL